jgi:hypothetical protein
MSSLFDLLGSQLGGSNLQQMSGGIADQLGIDPGQASAAVASAMPLLLGALAKNASTPHGADKLSSVLDRDHDGSVLDDLGSAFSGGASASGMRAVNHIFGADSASVTNHIGQQSGLDMAQVTKILAMLAPIVLGFLGRQRQQQGSGFDLGSLASMFGLGGSGLGGASAGAGAGGGNPGDLLGGVLGSLFGGGGGGSAKANAGGNDGGLGDLAQQGANILGSLFSQR